MSKDQRDNNCSEDMSVRLHIALDLMQVGIEIMRQNLRRKLPEDDMERVDFELQRWIEEPAGQKTQ